MTLEALELTIRIACRTLPIIFLTLIVVEILSWMGVMNRLGRLLGPLSKVCGLPGECAGAVAVSFGSSLSADSMTAQLWREKKLSASQTLVAAQANTVAPYILETATYMTPVIVPTLGFKPGMVYLGAFLFTAILKLALVIIWGRRIAGKDKETETVPAAEAPQEVQKESIRPEGAVQTILGKAGKTTWRTARLMIPATFIICLAVSSGVIGYVENWLGPFLDLIGLNDNLLAPVAGYMASPMAGAAAIGALYKGGAINAYNAALAALLGSLLSLPVFWVRYTIPRNMGLFGARLGIANSGISLAMGMGSRLLFIAILPLFTRFLA